MRWGYGEVFSANLEPARRHAGEGKGMRHGLPLRPPSYLFAPRADFKPRITKIYEWGRAFNCDVEKGMCDAARTPMRSGNPGPRADDFGGWGTASVRSRLCDATSASSGRSNEMSKCRILSIVTTSYLTACLLVGTLIPVASGQTYPSRPVKIVVP